MTATCSATCTSDIQVPFRNITYILSPTEAQFQNEHDRRILIESGRDLRFDFIIVINFIFEKTRPSLNILVGDSLRVR